MVVRMRLARYGHRNLPFYRIVVANARAPRNGKFIEKIGTYDPVPDNFGNKHIRLNTERVKYWLSVGVQPTDTMARLLSKFNLYPAPPYRTTLPYDMTIFARPLPIDDKQYPDPRTPAAARNPQYRDRIPSDEPVKPNPPTHGEIEKKQYIHELRQNNILKRYIPTQAEREATIQSELSAKIARIESVRIPGIEDDENEMNIDEKNIEIATMDTQKKGMMDEKEMEEYRKQPQIFQHAMEKKEEDGLEATDNNTSEPASSASPSPSTSSAEAEPASSTSTSTSTSTSSAASSTTPKREYHTATSTSTHTSHLYRHPSRTLLHRCTSPYTSTHVLLSRWHV